MTATYTFCCGESGRPLVRLSQACVDAFPRQGDCSAAASEWVDRVEWLGTQADFRRFLRSHGAWDDEDLAQEEANRERVIWIATVLVAEHPDLYRDPSPVRKALRQTPAEAAVEGAVDAIEAALMATGPSSPDASQDLQEARKAFPQGTRVVWNRPWANRDRDLVELNRTAWKGRSVYWATPATGGKLGWQGLSTGRTRGGPDGLEIQVLVPTSETPPVQSAEIWVDASLCVFGY